MAALAEPVVGELRALPGPQAPLVSVKPDAPAPALEGPAPLPPVQLTRQRSRARVGLGVGLVMVGTGLVVGTTLALVARRSDDARIAALDALATKENRPFSPTENADVAAWDTRYARLENTAKALGTLAGLSILAGVIVLAFPAKRQTPQQARVRPLGAGVRITF